MREVLQHYGPHIEGSTILRDVGLTENSYVLASIHREENVDEPSRLLDLFEVLLRVHKETERPVLVSTHPRTRERLRQSGLGEHEGLVFHPPFGYFDYVHLQTHAFCVLSDSGSLSEEAAILGFPAVCLRPAIERPEALEAGVVVTTSLDPGVVLNAVEYAVGRRAQPGAALPDAYSIADFSRRVVNFVLATMHVHHDWDGIRRRSSVWSGSELS